MQVADLAWSAGLFDGEGCICLSKSPPGKATPRGIVPHYRFQVSVAMCHQATIERLHQLWGGRVYFHPAKERRSPHWTWSLSTQPAADFLEAVQPYLIAKAEEASLAIAYRRGLPAVQGRRGVSSEELARREEFYLALKDAKTYWREDGASSK